jgi:hypothetical protein
MWRNETPNTDSLGTCGARLPRLIGRLAPLLLVAALMAGVGFQVPADARSAATGAQAVPPAPVAAVVKVGMTVEDMDRALAFYTNVLDFEVLSDVEVLGPDYEALTGVFGLRARIVELRLGDETIELTEYLTPRGREIPRDSRSNDRWF